MESKIEQLVSAVLSPNNDLRQQAEQEFENLCKEQTRATLVGLLEVMVQKPSLAELCALLVQKKIITVKSNATQLGEEEFKQLVAVCLQFIESPQSTLNCLRRVSEILVHLYRTVGSL